MTQVLIGIFVVTILSLVGCTTVPQASIESTVGIQVKATDGAIVAETLTNSGRITGPLEAWDELVLWRIEKEGETLKDEEKTFKVKALTRSSEAQQYMGVVPAGHYKVGLLWAFKQQGDTSYWAKAIVPTAIGSFEVKAGQVTDLGKIIYHPFQSRSLQSTTLPDYAITRIDNKDLLPRLKSEYTDAFKRYGFTDAISNTWINDDSSEQRKLTYEKIVESASAKKIHRIGDALLLTGRLGLSKSVNTWQANVTQEVVHDLIELNDSTLVVGGEMGSLTLLDHQGKLLKTLDALQPLDHVYDLHKINDDQFYLAILKNRVFKFYIYTVSTGTLDNIGKHERKDSFFMNTVTNPIVLVDERALRLYVDAKQHTYDFKKKVWTKEKFANLARLDEQGNGLIIAAPSNAWSGYGKPLYSNDSGKTWKAYAKPIYYRIYRAKNGVTLRTDKSSTFNFWTGVRSDAETVPVMKSTDNGIKWVKVGDLPIACKELSPSASTDQQVLALCEDGRVMASADMGVMWEELSPATTRPFDEFPTELKVKYQ